MGETSEDRFHVRAIGDEGSEMSAIYRADEHQRGFARATALGLARIQSLPANQTIRCITIRSR